MREQPGVEHGEKVEGSHDEPGGMMDVGYDPESPYYRDVYGDHGKAFVLFGNGKPRSALSAKARKDMGITNVAQLAGGMPAWRECGGPTVEKRRK